MLTLDRLYPFARDALFALDAEAAHHARIDEPATRASASASDRWSRRRSPTIR